MSTGEVDAVSGIVRCVCCGGEGGHEYEPFLYGCLPKPKPQGRRRGWRAELPDGWVPPTAQESPTVADLDKSEAFTRQERRLRTSRLGAERRAMRKRNAFVEDIDREAVWKRDAGMCGICGQPADPSNWQLDHKRPLARGGLHAYINVQVSHPRCNARKWAHYEPDELAGAIST